jgi:hypothetical protein
MERADPQSLSAACFSFLPDQKPPSATMATVSASRFRALRPSPFLEAQKGRVLGNRRSSASSYYFTDCFVLRDLAPWVWLGCLRFPLGWFFHRLLEAPARPGLSFFGECRHRNLASCHTRRLRFGYALPSRLLRFRGRFYRWATLATW